MVPKTLTDISFLSGSIGDSITPEKHIPRKQKNIKSLATSLPIKYPIPNQDKNNLGIEKYRGLPPHVPKFPLGFKSLRNEADDDHHESTYTSRMYKDYTSHTDLYDYIENIEAMKNKNDDDK